VRFGVIYAALFGVSAVSLAAFLWWSTAGLLERQIEDQISADSAGLAERYDEGGPQALLDTIAERVAGNVDDDALYLVVDPSYHRLAGNLEGWPRNLTLDEAWRDLPIERAGAASLARVHYFELPGGLHMLIGRDIQSRAAMRELLADGMLWGAAIALALGSIGAWAVRGLFRSTIADVSATAAAVSAGDLSRRVRVAGSDDEFDLLALSINDMLDRIGRLMDGVKQVSNAIAHDLRTPITRARTRLEDVATHAGSEAELRAGIERAMGDLDGVVAVFQALLRIAEIEAGARRSAFVSLDLAPLLTDMAELYEAVAEERGMVLETQIPAHLPGFGDRDMIQQAIANLLDNALKFSPCGGRIRLLARNAGEQGRRKAGADAAADGVRIDVMDEGPGIPAPDRAHATERFFRGEQARSTPGSGLGLSLVLAVAQLHGGGIELLDAAPGLHVVMTLADAPRRS
jgi:signal transduction histidine kinase